MEDCKYLAYGYLYKCFYKCSNVESNMLDFLMTVIDATNLSPLRQYKSFMPILTITIKGNFDTRP